MRNETEIQNDCETIENDIVEAYFLFTEMEKRKTRFQLNSCNA